jgi:hypothetical protein
VWDRTGLFTPYFVEGTPQIPTVSNTLVFNDNNVIVISNISTGERTSYIVPRPVCDWTWRIWWKICLPDKI